MVYVNFSCPWDATGKLSNITVVFKLYDSFPSLFGPVPALPGLVSPGFLQRKIEVLGGNMA
jgi:hypothetical protein